MLQYVQMASIECLASARKLRGVVTSVCFGGVLLWILLGNYADEHRAPQHLDGDGRVGGRRLMSVPSRALPWHHLKASVDSINASDDCSNVHEVGGNVSQCDFVRGVDSCKNDDGFIDYLKFVYCTVPHKLLPLAMVILFVWLIVLFIMLGATAEEYFCPALKVMSQVLRLSQNVAGVTLLALGNGAPDIFAAFASINQADDRKASLAIGALFGAGIFVTTIVVGLVALCKPFSLTQRPFLRDIIFYTVAVYWTFYLLWTNSINLWNAVGFIGLYVFYVAMVILGRILFQKWLKPMEQKWIAMPLSSGDIPKPSKKPKGRELDSPEREVKEGAFGATPSPTEEGGGPVPVTIAIPPGRLPDEGKMYRFPSIGSSMRSRDVTTVVQVEEYDKEEDRDSGNELGASGSSSSEGADVLVPPADGRATLHVLSVPTLSLSDHHRRVHEQARQRGATIEPQINYNTATPKFMRKTISGALDIMEEVGAAVGIPHVPQIWEEVHRSHSFRAPTHEEEGSGGHTHHQAGEGEGEQREGEKEESDLESAPLLPVKFVKRPHPFIKLLRALWPFGESFHELGVLGKIYETIKSPLSVILTLTVPVVDDDEDLHNWNKWLNVLHCVISPLVIALFTKHGLYLIGGVFPVWTLVLILSTLLAIVVACTSRTDQPPRYHCVFAWVGFAVSVAWIYSVANEIVNLLQIAGSIHQDYVYNSLQWYAVIGAECLPAIVKFLLVTFGVVIKLSDGILGLTLLAWGNSIGDAVSNITMARQGFPRMAVGACFGGPLLNMLLGIGIASVFKSLRRKGFEFKLYFSQVEFLATLFLIASLASSLFVITLLRFKLRRAYGIYLVGFYLTFLVLAVLAEIQVFDIHIHGVLSPDSH